MDISTATARFLDYVKSFTQQEDLRPTPIDVKREHSLRVLDNARSIADSLDLPHDLHRLALLAALFHDVGRFPQYQRYGTFHDPSSTNHGLLGARTLAPGQSGLLDDMPLCERRMLRAVVAMHNRKDLPGGVSAELRLLTELVRDADKLDIMHVMITHFTSDLHDPVITLNVTTHPDHYTQDIFEDVYNGVQGDYKKLRWSNDFKLLLLGWVTSFSYTESLRLLHRRELAQKLFALLPQNDAMQRLQQRILSFVEQQTEPRNSASACKEPGG